jgi:hypothetical protein
MRRAKVNERKRAKGREKNLKIKKVEAELRLHADFQSEAETVIGRLVLNDFLAEGVSLFTEKPVATGLRVSLTLQEPRPFYVRGEVIECTEVASPYRVISDHSYPYRVTVKFTLETEDEHRAVAAYYEEIMAGITRKAA